MKPSRGLAGFLFAVVIFGSLLWQRYTVERRAHPVEAGQDTRHPTQQSPVSPVKARLADLKPAPIEIALPHPEGATPTMDQRDDPNGSHAENLPAETSTLSDMPTSPGAFKNVGNETALAFVETALWAAANRDLDSATGMIKWTATGNTQASFLQLPATLQQLAGTPEKLIAMALAHDVGTATDIQMTLHSVYGPSSENIRIRFTQADGSTSETQFLMWRTDSGWRRELGPDAVLISARKLVHEER